MVLDSDTNNGEIKLGGSAAGQTLTSGTGIYMNGSGHFRAGIHNGNRLTFDGSNIEIVTTTSF